MMEDVEVKGRMDEVAEVVFKRTPHCCEYESDRLIRY